MQKNQFLNNSRIAETINSEFKQGSNGLISKKTISQKDQMISLLEDKNNKLQRQIQKINVLMQQINDTKQEKLKQLSKRQSLIQITNDPDILNKQLNNCYKKIKLYQYEMQKLKAKTLGTQSNQKLASMQTQLKQKKIIQDRLKIQLGSIVKEIRQNSQKLSGGSQQLQIQKQFKNKSDELKFLKEMIKEYQGKQQMKQKILKTQFNHIKKIQKQFVENGGAMHQLQAVKQKALKHFQEGRLVKQQNKKQTAQQNYYERFNKKPNNQQTNNPSSTAQTQIQDRTKTHYESLTNELNLLQKVNKRYQKQFQQAEKTLRQMQGKNQLTSKRVQKLQKQIQQLNSSIKIKKTCIVTQNMKPLYKKSLKSVSYNQSPVYASDTKQVNLGIKQQKYFSISDPKRKRNIISMTRIEPQTQDNYQSK